MSLERQTPPPLGNVIAVPRPGLRDLVIRRTSWGLAVAGLLVAFALLYFHRPQGQFFFPRCTFYSTTGLLCPGCGGLRAAHEMLHGNVTAALRSNALLVLGVPALLAAWIAARMKVWSLTPTAVWVITAVLLLFSVLRNLPSPIFDILRP